MTAGQGAGALVVVPAHQEGPGVERCLRAFLDGFAPGELAVAVVVNGSTDDTAARARRVAAERPDVDVAELPVASKAAAMRAGAAHLRGVPALVIDADVRVPAPTVRLLLAAVDRPGAWVAGARPRVSAEGAPAAVRAYYRVWSALAAADPDVAGSGVIALSAEARGALDDLPDVTNDDGWLRRSVPADRRLVVDGPSDVEAARTVRALLSRRARIVNGNRRLAAGGEAGAGGSRRLVGVWRAGAVSAGDVLTFLALTAAARGTAAWRRLRRDERWGTDATSRAAR